MSENKTYRLTDKQALAQARNLRISPMKMRRVVDNIRGMKANEALQALAFVPQSAAQPVSKVIAAAIANASHNQQLNTETLWICQAYVDEGPVLKRIRPRAQGRANRIRKRTSHLTVVLESRDGKPQNKAPSRQANRPVTKKTNKPTTVTEIKSVKSANHTESAITTSTQEGAK